MASIKELAKQLGGDQEAAYRAYKALAEIVTRASAPDNDQERAAAAADLAAELHARGEPKKDKNGKEKPGDLIHSSRTRAKIARLLSYVAGAGQVPALTELLGVLDVREMARFALDRNASTEATDALIKALDEQVGPDFRVGVVNALSKRTGANVLKALKQATQDEDRPVRIAAVEALSRFPDPGHDVLIAEATQADCRRCQARAHKARVRLAETLGKAAKKSAARRIYNAIRSSDADDPEKKAAEIGLKAIG